MQTILRSVFLLVFFSAILFLFIAATLINGQSSPGDDKKWKAPPSAKNIQNPLAKYKDSPQILKLGKAQYSQQCATCHGDKGHGDGASARFLGKSPQDLTLDEFQSQTDGEIFWKISNGNPPMPAFNDILQDKDRWLIVNYLRTFSAKYSVK